MKGLVNIGKVCLYQFKSQNAPLQLLCHVTALCEKALHVHGKDK